MIDRKFLTEDDEASLLAVGGPALLSLLERRRDTALEKLYGAFVAGTADLRPVVASYVAIVDLIRDIETKLQNREHKE